MVWYDQMFLGTGCQSKLKMLKRRITNRAPHAGVFLITLPTNDHMVLEVIPSALLLQEHYPADDLKIIGMAFSQAEALELVGQIVSESFRIRGDVNIEAYLREHSKDRGKERA